MARTNDDDVDEQSAESFPASDAPATTQPGDDPVPRTTSGRPNPTHSSPSEAEPSDAASDG